MYCFDAWADTRLDHGERTSFVVVHIGEKGQLDVGVSADDQHIACAFTIRRAIEFLNRL